MFTIGGCLFFPTYAGGNHGNDLKSDLVSARHISVTELRKRAWTVNACTEIVAVGTL
jgi:hypothetical protein